jgi:predicted phosphodiesterase
MQRTKNMRRPDAILCGDFHLRESTPICRTDDFWTAQWNKVQQIKELQQKYNCPVIHSGDLFDHWKPSPYLLSMAISSLPDEFSTIYGNHDLPQHNLDLAIKCGINVLKQANVLNIYENTHWGQSLETSSDKYEISGSFKTISKEIAVWHVMTYQGKAPWPGCADLTARQILEKYPQYDLIVTGHNHKSFVERLNGRLLVNPGSLSRQTADQEDHAPKVYLYYADTNTVTPHILTHEKGVISREHIDRVEQRNERLTAFVEMLSEEWEEGISFEENLERFYQANNIRKSVMDIIRKAVE